MVIRNFHSYSSLFVLSAVVACQHAAVAPSSPSAKAEPPVVSATPAATASPAPVSPTATVTAMDPSPFVEVVRLGYGARLNVAGKRTFLSTEKLLLGVYQDEVRIEPALLEGLRQSRSVFPRVFGDMPESGWAVQTSYEERTGHSSLSRWTGSEWRSADDLFQSNNLLGISAWSNGRTLALVGGEYGRQLNFVQLGGARGGVPQLPRAARNEYGCVHGLEPAAMAALPSGEVYLTGKRCAVDADNNVSNHGFIIHSWAPGQVQPKTSLLPGMSEKEAVDGAITSVVATSNSDVLVAGSRVPNVPEDAEATELAYVAHFDGKEWRSFSAPPINRIDELQRAPDGRLWALSSGQLWSTKGAASEMASWQQVALPQAAKEGGEDAVSSFWVQDNEQVWATLGPDELTFLARTKVGSTPLTVPSTERVAQLSSAFDAMAAYQCESPTLLVVALSRQAPKDTDMPSLNTALRRHPELEGKVQLIELPFLTRRYLAVRGDMDSLIATHEILGNAKIPGAMPEMRCLSDAPTRTLSVDFGGPKPDLPVTNPGPHRKSTSKHATAPTLDF